MSDAAAAFHAQWPINTPVPTLTETGFGSDVACKRHNISSLHPGGALFAFGDGSVKFINQNIATNPALQVPGGPCSSSGNDPPSSNDRGGLQVVGPGLGFTYQNLYNRADGLVVSTD